MVGDLKRNRHYENNPQVTGAPGLRFYCGLPLRNARRTVIGTFFAASTRAREISPVDRQILGDLAVLAERELLTVELHSAQAALISKLSIARRQALIDPLTRTWNRRGGELLLREAIEHCVREQRSLAVLAVDATISNQ